MGKLPLCRIASSKQVDCITRDFDIRDTRGRAISGRSTIYELVFELASEFATEGYRREPGVVFELSNAQLRNGSSFGGGSRGRYRSLDEAQGMADQYLIDLERRVVRQFGED